MELLIGPHVIDYPAGPDELPLGAWVQFVRTYGQDLDARAAALQEIHAVEALEGVKIETHIQEMRLYMDRAYSAAAFFADIPLAQAYQELPFRQVVGLYQQVLPACFETPAQTFISWEGVDYILPPPELSQASDMTFGEVLDSKVMLQNQAVEGWSRWELIQHLAAIFLRPPGVPYHESMAYMGGAAVQRMAMLPMSAALMLSAWYEQLNKFLEAHFTIFQGSAFKPGRYMKKHFEGWGWVNFLKSVAKSKVFDIPGGGLNSMQCVRAAKAFDVMVWASEEKEYGEAQHAEMEEIRHKK